MSKVLPQIIGVKCQEFSLDMPEVVNPSFEDASMATPADAVGHWKFGEAGGTIEDLSVQGNDLVPVGTVYYSQIARNGYGVSVAGPETLLRCATPSGMAFGTATNFCVEGWFRLSRSVTRELCALWDVGASKGWKLEHFAETSANLLTGGGFETWVAGVPQGWALNGATPTNAIAEAPPYLGNKSALLSAAEGRGLYQTAAVTLQRGCRYRFSCYQKASVAGATVSVVARAADTYHAGTCTGGDNELLMDSEADFVAWGAYVGMYVCNDTKGSVGVVVEIVDEHTLRVSGMTGGITNDNDPADQYHFVGQVAEVLGTFATTAEWSSREVMFVVPDSGVLTTRDYVIEVYVDGRQKFDLYLDLVTLTRASSVILLIGDGTNIARATVNRDLADATWTYLSAFFNRSGDAILAMNEAFANNLTTAAVDISAVGNINSSAALEVFAGSETMPDGSVCIVDEIRITVPAGDFDPLDGQDCFYGWTPAAGGRWSDTTRVETQWSYAGEYASRFCWAGSPGDLWRGFQQTIAASAGAVYEIAFRVVVKGDAPDARLRISNGGSGATEFDDLPTSDFLECVATLTAGSATLDLRFEGSGGSAVYGPVLDSIESRLRVGVGCNVFRLADASGIGVGDSVVIGGDQGAGESLGAVAAVDGNVVTTTGATTRSYLSTANLWIWTWTWTAPRLPDLPVPVLFPRKRDEQVQMVSPRIVRYRVGHERRSITLSFSRVPQSSFDDLVRIIEGKDGTDFARSDIRYVHTDGTMWTAFVSKFSREDWVEGPSGLFRGTISLEIIA